MCTALAASKRAPAKRASRQALAYFRSLLYHAHAQVLPLLLAHLQGRSDMQRDLSEIQQLAAAAAAAAAAAMSYCLHRWAAAAAVAGHDGNKEKSVLL